MYQVKCDGELIYTPLIDKKIFDARLDLEMNKTGSFDFTIFPDHPNYSALKKMRSILTVYSDDDLIFRGRILTEEQGFYNEKILSCEGELAFFLDTYVRPYGSEGAPTTETVKTRFETLINKYNEEVIDDWKRFKIGEISADLAELETKHYSSDYKTTLDALLEIVDEFGGYIWFTHDGDETTINYLSEVNIPSNQPIEFGRNLLDVKKITKSEDLLTAIIPLGGKSDSRITIESVNDGNDYLVHDEAAASLGRIFKTIEFEEITTPQELKEAAQEYLNKAVKFVTSVELTAADLAGIENVNPFRLGQILEVKADKHGLDVSDDELDFRVRKLSIDILQPHNNKLTLGSTFSTFTESTSSKSDTKTQIAETVTQVVKTSSENFATIGDINELNGKIAGKASTDYVNQKVEEIELKEGKSAYEIWLEQGNTGSEADFLESLRGDDGTGVNVKARQEDCTAIGDAYIDADGNIQIVTSLSPITFTNGGQVKGKEGDSAYDIWRKQGNTGTEEDFLNSLKGEVDEETLARIENELAGKANTTDVNNALAGKANQSALNELAGVVGTKASTDDLNGVKAELKNADDTLNAAIGQETTNRQNADNALRERINTEKAEREASDEALNAAITAEKSARENADKNLSDSIAAEKTARINEDAVLNQALDAEKVNRTNEDNALSGRIDDANASIATEKEQREQADSDTNKRIDNLSNSKADKSELDRKADKEYVDEQVANSTGGRIEIVLQNITEISNDGNGIIQYTATITDEDRQNIIDDFLNTVLIGYLGITGYFIPSVSGDNFLYTCTAGENSVTVSANAFVSPNSNEVLIDTIEIDASKVNKAATEDFVNEVASLYQPIVLYPEESTSEDMLKAWEYRILYGTPIWLLEPLEGGDGGVFVTLSDIFFIGINGLATTYNANGTMYYCGFFAENGDLCFFNYEANKKLERISKDSDGVITLHFSDGTSYTAILPIDKRPQKPDDDDDDDPTDGDDHYGDYEIPGETLNGLSESPTNFYGYDFTYDRANGRNKTLVGNATRFYKGNTITITAGTSIEGIRAALFDGVFFFSTDYTGNTAPIGNGDMSAIYPYNGDMDCTGFTSANGIETATFVVTADYVDITLIVIRTVGEEPINI